MKKYLFIITLITAILIACSKGSGVDNGGGNGGGGGGGGGGGTVNCAAVPSKLFAADANPIIQNNCTLSGCHNAGSTNGPGPLLTYAQIFAARTTIRSAVISGIMPQGSTLTTEQKNIIICWIDAGAQNN